NRNKYEEKISKSVQLGVLGVGIIFIIGVSSYCYKHLPIVDFRPYKIGTDIQEKMIIPVDAPQAEYKTILEYKKNNEIKEFSIDNLPDSTWEWVSSQNILIEEGYVPPIHDFNINTLDGNDITDIVLNEDKFTFILVAYDLAISDIENIKSIEYVYKYCKGTTNCNFIALTSSLNDDISKFKKENRASFPFYNTDEITLKTIVRSNPGLVLIKNGIILNKWHNNDIPGIQNLKKDFLTNKKFNSNIDKNKRTKLNA
ncbi:MAG: DoxX family protein, partial [Bacteroidota bacterium]|nr:DoxX family protein [Bacteroidota bacterium]